VAIYVLKPQDLSTKLAAWTSRKDYHDYCLSLSVSEAEEWRLIQY
jgi:hypothetical protein